MAAATDPISLQKFMSVFNDLGISTSNRFEIEYSALNNLRFFASSVQTLPVRQNTMEVYFEGRSIEVPTYNEYEHEFTVSVINDNIGYIYTSLFNLCKTYKNTNYLDTHDTLRVYVLGDEQPELDKKYPGITFLMEGVRIKNVAGLSLGWSNDEVQTFDVTFSAIRVKIVKPEIPHFAEGNMTIGQWLALERGESPTYGDTASFVKKFGSNLAGPGSNVQTQSNSKTPAPADQSGRTPTAKAAESSQQMSAPGMLDKFKSGVQSVTSAISKANNTINGIKNNVMQNVNAVTKPINDARQSIASTVSSVKTTMRSAQNAISGPSSTLRGVVSDIRKAGGGFGMFDQVKDMKNATIGEINGTKQVLTQEARRARNGDFA